MSSKKSEKRRKRSPSAESSSKQTPTGPTMKIKVKDTIHNREMELELPEKTRVEVAKAKIGGEWVGWRRIDMVLLGNGKVEQMDGDEISSGSYLLMTRASVVEAAEGYRNNTGKREDDDHEDWGVYGANPNQKVRVSVCENSHGHLASTITWKSEGHTLGNALRHTLVQNPAVLQCGYTIPHPLEDDMVMEITSKEYPPDLLRAAIHGLAGLCDETVGIYTESLEAFENKMEE
eukprot:TRINITY_DN6932_c0_g1_i1.p1 TRINITY_DN6932_c0_g1~~TRINITY_DN6932_c0_g1_i1.p1  ORF type:complete len:255 (+),score=40.95 TRINITY_DN6932_c0_g1_i1:68-766(+)